MVCVGVLVGKEGVCQKSLPLTEGMIHSRERGSTSERKRENSRKRERERGKSGKRCQ